MVENNGIICGIVVLASEVLYGKLYTSKSRRKDLQMKMMSVGERRLEKPIIWISLMTLKIYIWYTPWIGILAEMKDFQFDISIWQLCDWLTKERMKKRTVLAIILNAFSWLVTTLVPSFRRETWTDFKSTDQSDSDFMIFRSEQFLKFSVSDHKTIRLNSRPNLLDLETRCAKPGLHAAALGTRNILHRCN